MPPGRSSKPSAPPMPVLTAMARESPLCAMGTSSSGSSPTTASSGVVRARRSAALRSACADGFPTISTSASVTLVIIAEIARDVPRARPSAVAKNIDCEQL
jgi:hypothetical protein